jgi:hypothetical protein
MRLHIHRPAIRNLPIALVLAVSLAGTALATAASGFHPTIVGRATLPGPVSFNAGAIKFQTKSDVDIITITVAIDPSGSSGWLTRPGVVLASVAAGRIVLYDANCVGTVLDAGSAFTVSGSSPVLVRNESTSVAAAVNATFIVPKGTPNSGLRIDQTNPGCAQS